MATTHNLHDDIEPWLAAAVHDQLTPDERATFEKHLAACATCRGLHQEELTMSKMITSTFDAAKPDLAFEQRVVSRFREKLPEQARVLPLLVSLFRSRATHLTAVAAILLTLVQVGRLVTDEKSPLGGEEGVAGSVTAPGHNRVANFREEATDKRSVATGSYIPTEQTEAGTPVAMASADTPPRPGKDDARQAGAVAPKSRPQSPAEAVLLSKLEDKMRQNSEDQSATPPPPDASRKLVRNAQVELEVLSFDETVQKITALAGEGRGYIATSNSQKQANGKLRGVVVVKVLPETLDAFLLKLRGLGELKNQTLGTDDVTKKYFDTDSRVKNARIMEERLIEMLEVKNGRVADLLQVEKELGRVRAEIEQMQGELKYMDALVQFATVTITLAEKDMNVPAAFLLKRRAQLALFSTDVEKTFEEVKGVIDGAKAQISSSTLDRDSAGEATARLVLLIAPEEADALIGRIKGMGRVQNYNEQTDRLAQGGNGMGENAKVERDKVELSITISRHEQEPALQTTSLRILTSVVTDKVTLLKENAAKSGAEIRSSSFSRTPDGQEFANISLRVPMKNYPALLSSFDQLGKVKDVSVQRDDRRGTINEATAPADINIQVHSQPNIVSDESGLFATIRRTLAQGAAALLWSLRMIGVALAFFAPWVLAIVLVILVTKRISRARKARQESKHE